MMWKSPHKRGDVPTGQCRCAPSCQISPQAWGCTECNLNMIGGSANLPTSVGMYRTQRRRSDYIWKSPHKRGDVPDMFRYDGTNWRISPQAWGCTGGRSSNFGGNGNLPTSVGMYRRIACRPTQLLKSPHKRGDVPDTGWQR